VYILPLVSLKVEMRLHFFLFLHRYLIF